MSARCRSSFGCSTAAAVPLHRADATLETRAENGTVWSELSRAIVELLDSEDAFNRAPWR